jgi:hypothetical protein
MSALAYRLAQQLTSARWAAVLPSIIVAAGNKPDGLRGRIFGFSNISTKLTSRLNACIYVSFQGSSLGILEGTSM